MKKLLPVPSSTTRRLVSAIAFESMAKYLRLSVNGVENIPQQGPVIFISNHSGFSGMDALLLRYLIQKRVKKTPKIMLHRLWYSTRSLGRLADDLGFVKAGFAQGVEELKQGESLLIFPEGAHGNFKPYSKKYRLQNFKTGFFRMAQACHCPVVPVIILGPEESHINLKKIDLKFSKDSALPLPLNVWPLPAKWRVNFLKPMDVSELAGDHSTFGEIRQHVKDIENQMRASLKECLSQRGHPYI